MYSPEFLTWQKEANIHLPPSQRQDPCRSQLSPAVKMSGFLPVELAFHSATVLRGAEPLKPVVDELRVLLVKILMGHHVRGARIDLVTAHLAQAKQAVVSTVF